MSSRQLRALIALVAVFGVAVIVGINTPIVGVIIMVLGLIAIGVVLKRTADTERSEHEPRERTARSDDEAPDFEDLTGDGQPLTSRTRPAEAPEPLQTWTPPEPLQTWTPARNRAIEPTKAPSEPDTPWGTPEAPSAPEAEPAFESAPAAWDKPAANPLDDLDRLDDVDVVAEVERLDNAGAASTIEPPVTAALIQEEEVKTSDDVLAASDATQITIGAGDNTELAKLLAKVQERLTAYE